MSRVYTYGWPKCRVSYCRKKMQSCPSRDKVYRVASPWIKNGRVGVSIVSNLTHVYPLDCPMSFLLNKRLTILYACIFSCTYKIKA